VHPRRLYAHRGASAERPENTLVSFQRAMDIGVDSLEMDVHLTRDGVFVVTHDEDALRMCGSPVRWRDLDLADAQRLDAGWGFVAPDGSRPFAGQGIAVPTFESILVEFSGVHINVDIKGEDAAMAMLELVRRLHAEERVTIASFHTGTMLALRRHGYGGETGLSKGEVATLLAMPAVLWRQLPFTGTAAQIPTHQGAIHFDRSTFVAKCHSVGLRVDFWTIDDVAEAQRLLGLGADGIITIDPAAMKPVFAAL
jgi:glycerophosphoryl diester phosphodiesterase